MATRIKRPAANVVGSIDPDLVYAIRQEREMIKDEGMDIRKFRRLRMRLTFDSNPTEKDRDTMKRHGGIPFRAKIRDLCACQTLVNLDTVQTKIWQIRNRVVTYPFVELVRGTLVIVDGHHRVEAFRRLGRKTVVVQYHPSNWRL